MYLNVVNHVVSQACHMVVASLAYHMNMATRENTRENKIIKIPQDCLEEKIEIRGGETQIFIGENPKLDLEVILFGEGASLNLQGSFLGQGSAAQDIKLLVVQRAPQTVCRVNFRAVLSDSSSSFFDGLVRMEREAAGSVGQLSYKALLLSDKARSRPIPRLEVLTKKVASASHEASVGKIDERQLFYLQSRGLSLEDAKRLIVEGFLKI